MLHHYEQLHQQIKNVLDKQFFFVVGCQKSGTTWLEKILNHHPQMVCKGEALFGNVLHPSFCQALKAFNAQSASRNKQIDDVSELMFNKTQLDFLYLTAVGVLASQWGKDKPDLKLIGEKTPEHARTLSLLNNYFPNCKAVQIIRDGRDVAVSGWFHNLRTGGDKFKQKFPTLSHYIRYLIKNHWLPYINEARAFGKQHPNRYFELKYEDLHVNANATISKLFQFLEVDSAEKMITQCIDSASFKKITKGRNEGQEDRRSFFRKGVAGDWKNHFDQQALDTFMQLGGQMLRDLGYEI